MTALRQNHVADAVRAAAASAPKEDALEPSELWAALMSVPRPTREVPLPRNIPGTETPIGTLLMWPLTQEEQMAANAEADRYTKTLLKDPQKRDAENLGYHHTYTNEVAVQILFRACRDVRDSSKPAFPGPASMRARLTTDEIGVLFNQYCTVQAEVGPIRAYLTKEESESLILRLVEGGSALPFDSLSWEQQRTQVLSLASRLVACWTAMCTAGLRPDVSETLLERLLSISSPSTTPSPSESPSISPEIRGGSDGEPYDTEGPPPEPEE